MGDSREQKVRSLYVHVPFCARKCSYCAFYSEPSTGDLVNRFVEALVRELRMISGDLQPETIFFGGGTPSLLNIKQWERILGTMDQLSLLGAREWTIECNPATVSADKIRLLSSYGVNRISMGVQSLSEDLLDRLGRVHSREMVFKSFDILRQGGILNINLDLMFAIPGQTMNVWQETLTEAISMQSEHLSCYEVIYEEDTPLYDDLQKGKVDLDEDLACDMYDQLLEQTAAAGMFQYEIANFARNLMSVDGAEIPSHACRHNLNYWHGGQFYGVGPSATSYIGGIRTKNWANTQMYCEQIEQGRRAIESREELGVLARAGETAAFGLRTVAGWSFEQFQRVTGQDLRQHWKAEMLQLEERGWGRQRSDGFQLTLQGLRFADAAAEMFLR
jgi:oxygen-independent coproporphyrinogen-3 oxidase